MNTIIKLKKYSSFDSMHFLVFWTCRKQWWRGVAWSETTDNLKVTGVKNMSLINLFKKTSPSRSSKSWQIPKRLCTSASVSYLENRLGHTLWRSSLVSLVSRRERCLICIWFSTSSTVIRRFVRIIVWTCSMLSSVVNISENPADLSVQCWTLPSIHTHSTDKKKHFNFVLKAFSSVDFRSKCAFIR